MPRQVPVYQVGEPGWEGIGGCRWRRDDDDFAFNWPELGLGATLFDLRDSGSDTYAKIRIERTNVERGYHLMLTRINLWSSTAGKSLAGNLAERYEAPWPLLLEQAFVIAKDAWTQASPIVDLKQYVPKERPPDLIPGFLPYGTPTILYGKWGTGKSNVALAAGAMVLSGMSCAYLKAAQQGPVMVLDAESYEEDVRHRMHAILTGMGVPGGLAGIPDGWFLYQRVEHNIIDSGKQMGVEMRRRGVKLVIGDSIAKLVGGSVKDDDTANDLMRVIRRWGDLTTLLLAHIPKSDVYGRDAGKGPASILGSGQFEAQARKTWEIRKSDDITKEQGMAVALFNRKVNLGFENNPLGLRLHFDGDPQWPSAIRFGGWSVDADPTLAGGISVGKRLKALLRRHGPMDNEDAAEQLGVEAATVRAAAARENGITNINTARGRGAQARWSMLSEREEGT